MRIPSGQHGGARKARIEIIPLIDIMFFLLATFIMVSLSMVKNQGVPVNLPAAHAAKATEPSEAASVTITKTGDIFWNKEKSSLEGLTPHFLELAQDPDSRLFIHGDKQAEFGLVVAVLDAAKKAGVHKTAIRTGAGHGHGGEHGDGHGGPDQGRGERR